MSTTSMVELTEIRPALDQFLATLEESWTSGENTDRLTRALKSPDTGAFDRDTASVDLADLSQQLLEAGLHDPGGRAAELALALSPASRDARRVLLECSRHYGFEPTTPDAAQVVEEACAPQSSEGGTARLRHLLDEIEFSFKEDVETFAIGSFRIWPLIRQLLQLPAASLTEPSRPDQPIAATCKPDQLTFFTPRRDTSATRKRVLSVLDEVEHDRSRPGTSEPLHGEPFALHAPAGLEVLHLAEFDTRRSVSEVRADALRFYRTPWLGDRAAALARYTSAFKAASDWNEAQDFLEALFEYPDIAARLRDPERLAEHLVTIWAYAVFYDDLLGRAQPLAVVLPDTGSPKMFGLALAARNQDVPSLAVISGTPDYVSPAAAWPEEAFLAPDHLLRTDALNDLARILTPAAAEEHPAKGSTQDEARDRLETFFASSPGLVARDLSAGSGNTDTPAEAPAAAAPAKAPAKPRPARTLLVELDLRRDLTFHELYRHVLKTEMVRKTLGFEQIFLNVLAEPRSSYDSWHFHNNMTMALLRLNSHVKGLNMVFSKAELKQYRRWWKRYRSIPYWVMANLPVGELGHRKQPNNLKVGVRPARETQSLVGDWVTHRAGNKPFVTWSGAGHANGQAQAIFDRLDRELAGNYAILYLPPDIERIDPAIVQDPRFLFAEEALYNLDLRAGFHYAAFANLTDGAEAALTPAVISDTLTVLLDGSTARVQRRGVLTRYASVAADDSRRICELILENYFERT